MSTDSFSSRRRFLKLLAASPLLSVASLAALPTALRDELLRMADGSGGSGGIGGRPPVDDFLISSVDEAVNVFDFEALAKANSLPEHWEYLAMGTGDHLTLEANREGFRRLQVRVRRLADIGGGSLSGVDMSTEIFGERWNTPLFLCPVASLRGYHTQGEVGAARAAGTRGTTVMQSTVSSNSVEEINEGLSQVGADPVWYQLYTLPEWNQTLSTIRRVEAAGCRYLLWTIDNIAGGKRETLRRALGPDGYNQPLCQECHEHEPGYTKPMRRDLPEPSGERPEQNWDYLQRLKDATDMRIILKGINHREDAERAVELGADGIYVSNHGGRTEESYRPAIFDLPEVAAGVDGRVPVFFDSGVRRGGDMFKALALGADAVGIGRPYVWGLTGFGQPGVEGVIDMLNNELRLVMGQAGTTSIDAITSDYVEWDPYHVLRHTPQGIPRNPPPSRSPAGGLP